MGSLIQKQRNPKSGQETNDEKVGEIDARGASIGPRMTRMTDPLRKTVRGFTKNTGENRGSHGLGAKEEKEGMRVFNANYVCT